MHQTAGRRTFLPNGRRQVSAFHMNISWVKHIEGFRGFCGHSFRLNIFIIYTGLTSVGSASTNVKVSPQKKNCDQFQAQPAFI